MSFASKADRDAIEQEMPWAERDLPKTLYGLLSQTAGKFPDRPAISYQIFSGPTDKAETVTWKELHAKTAQAANLFRSLGVGEKDVVAYVLPNANETIYTLLGAPSRASPIRSTRFWSPSRSAPSCAKPAPRLSSR